MLQHLYRYCHDSECINTELNTNQISSSVHIIIIIIIFIIIILIL